MSKTNKQLQEELKGVTSLYNASVEAVEELENQLAELELQLESGAGEEVPEHGHSRHESRQERQNRLRSRHMRKELATLTDAA